MPDPKDDNHAPLDKVRDDRGLARGSGFIAKRIRDLARDVKDRELVGRGENNGFESEWGGEGSGPGEFRRPTAIAVDKEGNVLVADIGNRRIQKFDSNGRFLDAWEIYADDSDKHASESDSRLPNPRIFVDETGTVSLIDQSGQGPWDGCFVGRLDSKEGVLRRDLSVIYYMGYGFVHPEGNVYIRHYEPSLGLDQIGRFSTDWNVTGSWGAAAADIIPELPFPMEQPLFTDPNGDIYSLFPGQYQPFAGGTHIGRSLTDALDIVQSYAGAYHLITSGCRGEHTRDWVLAGDWGSRPRSVNDSDSKHELCWHRGLGDELTVGRSRENTIVIDDSTVSRHHARISFDQGEYHLEDLGSKNGTRLNGSNVTRARLGSQSTIKVGKEEIKFFCPAWMPRLWQMLSEIDSDIVRDDEPFFVGGRYNSAPATNPVILKFSSECEPIEVWAPKLRDPHLETGSFAVNVDGGVFFLCGGCNEVKELSKDGDLMDEWGEEGTGPGQFDGPMGIAAGLVNEIYVADTGNHRIQKFRTSVKA